MNVTFAEMCIDAHVTSSASQTLVFTIRNVFVSFWVNVFLCQPKVNYVDNVPALG